LANLKSNLKADPNGSAFFCEAKPFPTTTVVMQKDNTSMDTRDIDRIIEMAWEDRTPFEAIEFQFGITEAEVIKLMRKELKQSSFKLWRKRVNSGTSQKHLNKRNKAIKRFKCSRQKSISYNKISKR
jgi:uncharacterized protein (TIGR03643 family)